MAEKKSPPWGTLIFVALLAKGAKEGKSLFKKGQELYQQYKDLPKELLERAFNAILGLGINSYESFKEQMGITPEIEILFSGKELTLSVWRPKKVVISRITLPQEKDPLKVLQIINNNKGELGAIKLFYGEALQTQTYKIIQDLLYLLYIYSVDVGMRGNLVPKNRVTLTLKCGDYNRLSHFCLWYSYQSLFGQYENTTLLIKTLCTWDFYLPDAQNQSVWLAKDKNLISEETFELPKEWGV